VSARRRPQGKQSRAAKSLPSAGARSNGVPGAGQEDRAKDIQELIDLLKRNDLAELEWESQGFRLRLRRDTGLPIAPLTPPRESPSQTKESSAERSSFPLPTDRPGAVTITSPIVGTFYRSPSPDADPYVEEGDLVKKGQVLCIVEAMKLMNEIESEVDGRIIKILVESTKPVEYGQPLFLIDPTPGT
jgi:acetyl-CoA carboxylase biotin carboxyl carrier protein